METTIDSPLSRAETTVEAIAPRRIDLREPFSLALRSAEDHANDILDELLPFISHVQLDLRNRELQTQAEVEALLDSTGSACSRRPAPERAIGKNVLNSTGCMVLGSNVKVFC